jgi:glutaredoxin
MNRVLQSCSVLLLLLCAASAHAQLYKWVGPNGKVTYSDTPPPQSASRVETKAVTGGEANSAGLPYEIAEAMKNHPVTLYTTKNCNACDDGRKLLSERGIPFSEKTVNTSEDVTRFRQAGGEGQLPLLVIGHVKERGFEPSAWNSALSAASYPETSKLPKTYRNPQAETAAPAPPPAPAKQGTINNRSAAQPAAGELPPAIGNAPPGFRF